MQIHDQGRTRPLVQQLRRRRSLRAGLTQLIYIAVGSVSACWCQPSTPARGSPASRWRRCWRDPRRPAPADRDRLRAAVPGRPVRCDPQSPRMHLFRDNPLVWHALGLVVGVIIYATTCVVVTASAATTNVLVPISVIILVVLAVAITRRLQLSALGTVDPATTLDRVTTRTRTVVDRLYTEPFSQSSAPPPTVPDHSIQIRWPGSQQFLREVDLTQLIRLARQAGGPIRLRLMPGDLVRENAVVLEVWNRAGQSIRVPF
jgi:hypothetical protein